MKEFSLTAALLAGLAFTLGTPGVAEPSVPTAPPSRTAADRERARIEAMELPTTVVPVAPAVTAATPVAVTPAAAMKRPTPTYAPDGGDDLSGLPYRRGEAVKPATAPIGTLQEAIALAYRTNPQLLAARAQAQAADFLVPEARSAFGPTLTVSGAYTFTRTRIEAVPGIYQGAQGWASDAQAILSQPIFTFGRNAAGNASAEATAQFQRDSLRVTEAQVLLNVASVYVAVLRDAASVAIARDNLALLEQQLAENETRYKVRDLTLTDLDQTRTRLELGRAQLLQAQGQLGVSQKQFLQYVGAPPGQLAPPDALDIKFASLEDAYSYGEANSGLIRAAQAREKVSRAQVMAVKAEFLPRVDAQGTFSYSSTSPYNDRLRQNQITGQFVVSQTLFSSGLRSARLNNAEEANDADWRLLDSTYRDTRSAIGSAWDQLASSRTSLDNYRKAIAAAQRAYEGALIQQKTGDRTTLDVLDLARDLLTVRNNYNVTVASEYIARASLLAAVGLLEGPSILPDFPGYDADAHYERIKNRGGIPLLTSALFGLDRLATSELKADRPSRDAGAQQALEQSMPLPPANAPSPIVP